VSVEIDVWTRAKALPYLPCPPVGSPRITGGSHLQGYSTYAETGFFCQGVKDAKTERFKNQRRTVKLGSNFGTVTCVDVSRRPRRHGAGGD
jgi:hypothetical protein